MQLVQILHFLSSTALLANQALLNNAVSPLSSVPALDSAYVGRQVEDQQTAYVALVWGSISQPPHFNPNTPYLNFINDLPTLAAGPVTSYWVDYQVDPHTALGGPVTEVSTSTLNAGKTHADLVNILDRMEAIYPSVVGAHAPFAWGKILAHPKEYSIIAGWDSVAAHFAAAQSLPLNALVPELVATVSTVLAHVDFTKVI